jgi:hypothetical protein
MYNTNFWLGIIFLLVVFLGKDLYFEGILRDIKPTNEQLIQEVLYIVY